MKGEGQKAPSIDDLKEASSEEEFKARLKEGQAFRLKEKAGFHVISRRNVPDRVRTWNSNFEKLAGRENTA